MSGILTGITDGHYGCSPSRFIGHSGFLRCQYYLFVGLLERYSILTLSDWPRLWRSPSLLVSVWASRFPGFCACYLFFVQLTNDARCILSLQNAFVQLSLAFRNDNYTLETRQKQAERERSLTEENTEKELEEFKNTLKVSLVRTAYSIFLIDQEFLTFWWSAYCHHLQVMED